MSGNSIGQLFKVTTFGESHGEGIGCVIDGCPPRLKLDEEDIQQALNRRRPGKNRFTTARSEPDQVQILSGTFEGLTTGTPIGLFVKNTDQRSKDYSAIKDVYRPGHADFTYQHKYGIRDYRGGGRASARETVARVAAGAIAQKYLSDSLGIEIRAYVDQIGSIKALQDIDLNQVDSNPFYFGSASYTLELEELFQRLQKEGDSIGASIAIQVDGLPVGLGEPVFDRLDADLTKAWMSINAAKAVEIGDGFNVVEQYGSEHRDEMSSEGFQSNHSGGILGGISSGAPIYGRVAFKPTSSIKKTGQTLDKQGEKTSISVQGRHDPCVAIRAVPIVEAMTSIVLLDHVLRQRAQNFHQYQS